MPRFAKAIAVVMAAALTLCAAAPARLMVKIPAGRYRPLYATTPAIAITAFRIDRDPVTRGEFLAWRDGTGAPVTSARRPMTEVTWGEAKAFCQARGARLPTLAEWEYVASASGTKRSASADATFIQEVVSLYAQRSPTPRPVDDAMVNAFGVRGMHDLVWEWVADPNEWIAALHHAGMNHSHSKTVRHDMSCAGAAIGASDPRDYPAFLRGALRSGLTEASRLASLGFRCAA